MGLLSGVLSGIGLVGGLFDGPSTKKTAQKVVDAQVEAANANRALYERIYNQTRTDLEPGRNIFAPAVNAAAVRAGLAPMPAGSTPRAPQGAPAGAYSAMPGARPQAAPQAVKAPGASAGTLPAEPDLSVVGAPQPVQAAAPAAPDYAAYLAANPDVGAEFTRLQSTPEGQAQLQSLGVTNPTQFAQYHATTYAPSEGRNIPTTGGDPNAPPPQYYEENYAQRPDALAVPEFNRPEDLTAPTFGDGPQFSWDPSQIAKDAGFQFETKEAAAGVNANAAARGALRSGGAVKALQDRLFGVAHTYGNDYFNRALSGYNANRNAFESNRGFDENRYRYGQGRQDTNYLDDRSYGTNLYTTLQGRNDDIFSQDRSFAAGRNDQQNSNIFGLINVGANAAAGTASAGNTFANATANQNSNVADARSNAALWRAQNASNPFGSAAKLAGAYFGAI